MEKLKQLHELLVSQKIDNKSFEEFSSNFSGNPEKQRKLHDLLVQKKIDSKPFEEFQANFFAEEPVQVKKKESASALPSQDLGQSPVSGKQQGTVSAPTTKAPTQPQQPVAKGPVQQTPITGTIGLPEFVTETPAEKPLQPGEGVLAQPKQQPTKQPQKFGEEFAKQYGQQSTVTILQDYLRGILRDNVATEADVDVYMDKLPAEEMPALVNQLEIIRKRKDISDSEKKLEAKKTIHNALSGQFLIGEYLANDIAKYEDELEKLNPQEYQRILAKKANDSFVASGLGDKNEYDARIMYSAINQGLGFGKDLDPEAQEEAKLLVQRSLIADKNLDYYKSNPSIYESMLAKRDMSLANIDSQIKVLRENRLSQYENQIDSLNNEIAANPSNTEAIKQRDELIRNRDKYLDPAKEESKVIGMYKSEVMQQAGATPREKLKNYYISLEHERRDLEKRMPQGAFAQTYQATIGGTAPVTDRYNKVVQRMNSIAPIVFFNQKPYEQGIAESTVRQFYDMWGGKRLSNIKASDAQVAGDILESLTYAGIDPGDISKEAVAKLRTETEGYGLSDPRFYSNMFGMLGGVGLQGMAGGVVGKAFQAPKWIATGPKMLKTIYNMAKAGSTYEITGNIFKDSADEFDFVSGVAGGAAGELFKLGGNVSGKLLKNLGLTFGENTPKAVAVIKKHGQNFLEGAAGETAEETLQDLWHVYRDTGSFKQFLDEHDTWSENLKYFIGISLMGGTMGMSTGLGKEAEKEAANAFNELTPEEQETAREYIGASLGSIQDRMEEVESKQGQVEEAQPVAEEVTPAVEEAAPVTAVEEVAPIKYDVTNVNGVDVINTGNNYIDGWEEYRTPVSNLSDNDFIEGKIMDLEYELEDALNTIKRREEEIKEDKSKSTFFNSRKYQIRHSERSIERNKNEIAKINEAISFFEYHKNKNQGVPKIGVATSVEEAAPVTAAEEVSPIAEPVAPVVEAAPVVTPEAQGELDALTQRADEITAILREDNATKQATGKGQLTRTERDKLINEVSDINRQIQEAQRTQVPVTPPVTQAVQMAPTSPIEVAPLNLEDLDLAGDLASQLEQQTTPQEVQRDQEDIQRLPSEERIGQEPVQAEPIEGAGREAVAPGGMVQEQGQEVAPVARTEAGSKRAYDFDDTLYDPKTKKLTPLGEEVKARIAAGEDVTIVTARNSRQTGDITKALGISKGKIQATGSEAKKGEVLDNLGIDRNDYYDADQAKMQAIQTKAEPVAEVEPIVEEPAVTPDVKAPVAKPTAEAPAVATMQPVTAEQKAAVITGDEISFNYKSPIGGEPIQYTGKVVSEGKDATTGLRKLFVETEVEGTVERLPVFERDIVAKKTAEPAVEAKPKAETKAEAKKPVLAKKPAGAVEVTNTSNPVTGEKSSLDAAGMTEQQLEEWKKANKVQQRKSRLEQVQEAVKKLLSGEISFREYLPVARNAMKSEVMKALPKPTSLKDVVASIDKAKRAIGIVGLNKFIKPGTKVGLRLDIPSFNNYGRKVVAVHEGGKPNAIGYGNVASIKNVTFDTRVSTAAQIASGQTTKMAFAKAEGEWIGETQESLMARAEEAMTSPDWVQVSMNPFKHSFFFDRADGNPVISADEVIQIGNLLLAKNPVKLDLATDAGMKQFRDKFSYTTKDGVTFQFREGEVTGAEVSKEKAAERVKRIKDFFKNSGIEVNEVTSAEMSDIVGKDKDGKKIGGVFFSSEGKIYLNTDQVGVQDVMGDIIAFHEATHPVVNIIRNTNPKLYDAIVKTINSEAKTNPEVAKAVDDVKKVNEGNSKETIEDETVVEVLARIAAGEIDLSKFSKPFKDKLIDFMNMVANMLGLPNISKTSTNSEFKKFADKLSTALNTAEGNIADVVGEEQVRETQGREVAFTEQIEPEENFTLNGQDTFFHASESKRKGRLKPNKAPQFGVAVYFGTDKDAVEEEFGDENTTEVKLNIKNPVYAGSREWKKVENDAIKLANEDWVKKNKNKIPNWWDEQEDGPYQEFSDLESIDSKFISDAAIENGYDAIINDTKGTGEYGDEIAVLDESAIVYPEDLKTTPQSDVEAALDKMKNAWADWLGGGMGAMADPKEEARKLANAIDATLNFGAALIKMGVTDLAEWSKQVKDTVQKTGSTWMDTVSDAFVEKMYNESKRRAEEGVKPTQAPAKETETKKKVEPSKLSTTGKTRQRGVEITFLEHPEIAGETLDQMIKSQPNYYETIDLGEVLELARKEIEEQGFKALWPTLMKPGSTDPIVAAMRMMAIQAYSMTAAQARRAGDIEMSNKISQNLEDLLIVHGADMTKAGQFTSVMSQFGLMAPYLDSYLLSRAEIMAEKVLAKVDPKTGQTTKQKADNAAKDLNEAKKAKAQQIADAVVSTPEVEGAKVEKQPKILGMTKKDAQDKLKQALEEYNNIRVGGGLSAGGLQDAVAYAQKLKAAAKVGYYIIANGAFTFAEWTAAMKKNIPDLTDDELKDIWENEEIDGKILGEIAESELKGKKEKTIVDKAVSQVKLILGAGKGTVDQDTKEKIKDLAKAIKNVAKATIQGDMSNSDLVEELQKLGLNDSQIASIGKSLETMTDMAYARLMGESYSTTKTEAEILRQKAKSMLPKEVAPKTEAEKEMQKLAANERASVRQSISDYLRGNVTDLVTNLVDKGIEPKLASKIAELVESKKPSLLSLESKKLQAERDRAIAKQQKAVEVEANRILPKITAPKTAAEKKAAKDRADMIESARKVVADYINGSFKGDLASELESRGIPSDVAEAMADKVNSDKATFELIERNKATAEAKKQADKIERELNAEADRLLPKITTPKTDAEKQAAKDSKELSDKVKTIIGYYVNGLIPGNLSDSLVSAGVPKDVADSIEAKVNADKGKFQAIEAAKEKAKQDKDAAQATAKQDAFINSIVPKAPIQKQKTPQVALRDKIRDAIANHLVNPDGRTLEQVLMDDLNLDADSAQKIVQATANKTADELGGVIKQKANSIVKKATKDLIGKLVYSLVNGDLDGNQVAKDMAEYLGLPADLTPEQRQRLRDLAMAISEAKIGSKLRDKLEWDFAKEADAVLRHVGRNKKSFYQWLFNNRNANIYHALVYASMLNGIPTFLKNFVSVMPYVYKMATLDVANFTQWVYAAKTANEYRAKNKDKKGALNWWQVFALHGPVSQQLLRYKYGRSSFRLAKKEAAEALKTGRGFYNWDESIKQNKNAIDKIIESVPILERTNFIGGKWNPYNHIFGKMAGRVLAATDMLTSTYYENQEIPFAMLSEGIKAGMTRDQAIEKINEFLSGSSEKWQEALDQAREQAANAEAFGFKIAESTIQAEAARLMKENMKSAFGITQKQGQEMKIVARDKIFAHKRNGIFGTLADILSGSRIPGTAGVAINLLTKPIVPFTNIVGNMADAFIDTLPGLGFASANIPGSMMAESRSVDDRVYRHQMSRATYGTLALATLMMMAGDDEEDFLYFSGPDKDPSKAYKVYIGGKPLYDYRMRPELYLPIRIVQSYKDYYKNPANKDASFGEALGLSYLNALASIKDMSFLDGIADFVEVVGRAAKSFEEAGTSGENFEKFGKTLFEGLARPYIQFALKPLFTNQGIIRNIDKMIDPALENKQDFKESVAYYLGLQSYYNQKRVDIFGNVIKNMPGDDIIPLSQWLGLKEAEKNNFKILQENKVNMDAPSNPIRTFEEENSESGAPYTQRKMTPKEFFEYTVLAGKKFSEKIEDYKTGYRKKGKTYYYDDEKEELYVTTSGKKTTMASKRLEGFKGLARAEALKELFGKSVLNQTELDMLIEQGEYAD